MSTQRRSCSSSAAWLVDQRPRDDHRVHERGNWLLPLLESVLEHRGDVSPDVVVDKRIDAHTADGLCRSRSRCDRFNRTMRDELLKGEASTACCKPGSVVAGYVERYAAPAPRTLHDDV